MNQLVKAGPVGPDTARFQLHDLVSPCDLWCRFCPRAADVRRPPPGDEAVQRRVREAFVTFLGRYAHHDIVLVSSDILAWPDLFGLLDLARDAGRRVTLLTPGLALDDADFVDRLAAYPVRFDLTWLSADPDVHARITGVPGGHARLLAGIGHLVARGLPFRLSTVLQEDNVDDLPGIVTSAVALGARHVTVRLFWPDTERARPAYHDQFPTFETLGAALARLAASPPDPLPTVELTNVPLCQVDLSQALPVPVFVREASGLYNGVAVEGLEACATCTVRASCVRVHPEYLARHEVIEPDPARIEANVTHSRAILAAARQAAAGGAVVTEGWITPSAGSSDA